VFLWILRSFEPKNWLIGSTDDVIQKKNAKPTPILMSSTKNHKPETKIIFFILHTRLSKSLHGLNSSLAQSAGKLWLLAKMTKVTICGI